MSNYNFWKSEWDAVTSTDELFDSPDPQSGGAIKSSRKVTITITNKIVGKYEARSYPHDDIDGNGKIELYEVDVYEILMEGTDDAGNPKTLKYKALRFMPYYNNPKNPSSHYKTTGWRNAGLSSARTITVSRYIPTYSVQNRRTPGDGAIVLTGAFYIHAGPSDISNFGMGSAGCVEIIGSFDDFKSKIQSLSGVIGNVDNAIIELIKDRNLIVKIEAAKVPDIKSKFTREV